MNNAKLWLVVSPQVGLPIFLGAVAVGSFAVHVAVLTNTTWVGDYLNGRELGSTGQQAALTTDGVKAASSTLATYSSEALEGKTITVTLPDGTQAVAVIERPVELAESRASRRAPD